VFCLADALHDYDEANVQGETIGQTGFDPNPQPYNILIK
jgi:hypothetical protein